MAEHAQAVDEHRRAWTEIEEGWQRHKEWQRQFDALCQQDSIAHARLLVDLDELIAVLFTSR
jgi:hypothetical protein